MKKPTGEGDMPDLVRQAKEINEAIHEMIDACEVDDSQDLEASDDSQDHPEPVGLPLTIGDLTLEDALTFGPPPGSHLSSDPDSQAQVAQAADAQAGAGVAGGTGGTGAGAGGGAGAAAGGARCCSTGSPEIPLDENPCQTSRDPCNCA